MYQAILMLATDNGFNKVKINICCSTILKVAFTVKCFPLNSLYISQMIAFNIEMMRSPV